MVQDCKGYIDYSLFVYVLPCKACYVNVYLSFIVFHGLLRQTYRLLSFFSSFFAEYLHLCDYTDASIGQKIYTRQVDVRTVKLTTLTSQTFLLTN